MIQPIHTATIGEHQLRFFRRPINDGKPDLPWHAVEDLHRCLGLNRDLRNTSCTGCGPGRSRAPRRPPTALSPSRRSTCRKAASMRWSRKEWCLTRPHRIRSAETEAMKKLMAHLAFGTDAWFGWMKAAVNCHA